MHGAPAAFHAARQFVTKEFRNISGRLIGFTGASDNQWGCVRCSLHLHPPQICTFNKFQFIYKNIANSASPMSSQLHYLQFKFYSLQYTFTENLHTYSEECKIHTQYAYQKFDKFYQS